MGSSKTATVRCLSFLLVVLAAAHDEDYTADKAKGYAEAETKDQSEHRRRRRRGWTRDRSTVAGCTAIAIGCAVPAVVVASCVGVAAGAGERVGVNGRSEACLAVADAGVGRGGRKAGREDKDDGEDDDGCCDVHCVPAGSTRVVERHTQMSHTQHGEGRRRRQRGVFSAAPTSPDMVRVQCCAVFLAVLRCAGWVGRGDAL